MEWFVEEQEHLARVATRLPQPPSQQWFERLARARTEPSLDRAREALERHWLACARRPSQRLLRSPPYAQHRPMPGGGAAFYTYERSLWPRPLEEFRPPYPEGWEVETVGVRSRRAALWTFLITVRDLLRQHVHLRTWGLDEDDLRLLDLLAGPRWSWSQAWSQATLHHGLAEGRAGVFLLSSVRPDGLEELDLEALARAWRARPADAAAMLLVDTSLAPWSDFASFLAELEPAPLLTVQLVELNGWHMQGLSLGTAARLHFYGPGGTGLTDCQTAAELARRVRSVLGTALSFAELCQLDVPFLELDRDFAMRVWEHNRQVAPGTRSGFVGARPRRLGDLAHGWRRGPSLDRPAPVQQVTPPASWPQPRARYLAAADRGRGDVEELEGRLDVDAPPGWAAQGLLFRSGMAAISAVLAMLEKLGVTMDARYFETRFLHHVSGLAAEGALFTESVGYDWELRPWLPPEELPPVTIVDTTLTGSRFPMHRVLRDGLVIRLFSALKLDQLGLELENAGAVIVYSNQGQVPQVVEWLRETRRLSDTGLTPVEVSRLRAPFFLRDREHGERVFANNAWLAARLRPSPGLVARVVHPSLFSDLPWAVAPFTVLHLADEAIDCHRLLAAVLVREARRRRLDFVRGASFGFVGHRHEFIIPVLRENRALFKIAMGAGPGREAVADLLDQVLSLPDFAALRRAWPRLKLADPPTDWSAPSEALLRFLAED